MSVMIIAEAGVNHNGSLDTAKKMVDEAKRCGADIVKFQTARLDSLVSKSAKMAEYQKTNTGTNDTQKELLKSLLLSYNDFRDLYNYCNEAGIKFLSTPFDVESIAFLDELGCDIWKIPSGEITNLPYLIKIAQTQKPVIMSTGMSTLQEVSEAIRALKENGTNELTLLHCTTEYPAAYEDVNLNAMLTLKKEFGCPVGYSDHTKGVEISVAAVAMGATVIEKHFTLDKNMQGPDHKASLEPDELLHLVKSIRNVETALGDGFKAPSEAELKNIEVARKSIVALKAINKGELLTDKNITTKRPGCGISPMKWFDVLGTEAIKDFDEDELIEI